VLVEIEDEVMGPFGSPELPGHAPAVACGLGRGGLEIRANAGKRPGTDQEPRARWPETFLGWNLPAQRERVGAKREIDGITEDRRVGRAHGASIDDGRDALRGRAPSGLKPASAEIAPVIGQHARPARSDFRARVPFEEAVARLISRARDGRVRAACRQREGESRYERSGSCGRRAKRLRRRAGAVNVLPMVTTPRDTEQVLFWRPDPGGLPDAAWFGMSTRLGGVSEGRYATLNLGRSVGDREEAVEENRARLRAAAGTGDSGPILNHQVHGTTIVEPPQAPTNADGFLIRAGDPWVGVSTADCAPVALVAADGAHGALLHCGWRGTLGGIAARAVALLAGRGLAVAHIAAAVGPCLQACCFPIGPEVSREFDPAVLRPHPSGKAALDLPAAIAASLVLAGVAPDRICLSPECTSCRSDLYFSHRRDHGITGRHWSLLRLRS